MQQLNIQDKMFVPPMVDFQTGKTNWDQIRKRHGIDQNLSTTEKPLLYKVSNGFNQILDKGGIYHYNHPNFLYKDIFVDEAMFSFDAYNPLKRECKGIFQGVCSINDQSSFPEARWDHLSASLLMVIITQVGKTFHNLASDFNGVGLLKCDYKMNKAGNLNNLSFDTKSLFFERAGGVWCKSSWEIYNEINGEKELFCNANTVSKGVLRNYDNVKKKQAALENVP